MKEPTFAAWVGAHENESIARDDLLAVLDHYGIKPAATAFCEMHLVYFPQCEWCRGAVEARYAAEMTSRLHEGAT